MADLQKALEDARAMLRQPAMVDALKSLEEARAVLRQPGFADALKSLEVTRVQALRAEAAMREFRTSLTRDLEASLRQAGQITLSDPLTTALQETMRRQREWHQRQINDALRPMHEAMAEAARASLVSNQEMMARLLADIEAQRPAIEALIEQGRRVAVVAPPVDVAAPDTATLTERVTIEPVGIESAEEFGTPTITVGAPRSQGRQVAAKPLLWLIYIKSAVEALQWAWELKDQAIARGPEVTAKWWEQVQIFAAMLYEMLSALANNGCG